MALKLITSDPDERDVRLVWLLNLVPYLGLGYLYAVGLKGLKPILMLWVIEFIFATPLNLIWVYVLLSLIGTAQLISMRSPAKKLAANKQLYFDSRLNPPTNRAQGLIIAAQEKHAQSPLAGAQEEHALPTLERKAKRAERALKKLSSESLDKSKYAVDAFESKAQAAEKTLSASASDANSAADQFQDYSEVMTDAPDVMPENQPFFSRAEMAETQKLVDQDSNSPVNFSDGVDTSANQISENAPFFKATEAAYPKGSDDYSQNKTSENQPFFAASEIANVQGLNDYSQNQTPENQPFFPASEVADAKGLDKYDRSTLNEDLSNELSQARALNAVPPRIRAFHFVCPAGMHMMRTHLAEH